MARNREVLDWRTLREEFIRAHQHEQYQLDEYMVAWRVVHPDANDEQAEQECCDVCEAWGAHML